MICFVFVFYCVATLQETSESYPLDSIPTEVELSTSPPSGPKLDESMPEETSDEHVDETPVTPNSPGKAGGDDSGVVSRCR